MEAGSCSVDEIRIPADTEVTILVTNLSLDNYTFGIQELRVSRTLLPGEEELVVLNSPVGRSISPAVLQTIGTMKRPAF